ncbi:Serine/threonine protein kinase [Handroanthus impetiginosus]|uniref:non-specific serine/threonine protein kinase n=1 Tax=Handroanthus impetiginosus TaxID=429701 RepID=A0A2G9GDH0_9LAMI|nr:Serine/threonine protein kinase [Handroanthus impetiginosus]
MNPKPDSFFLLLILTALVSICVSQINLQYQTCRQTLLQCGNIREIGYPFWGGNRNESCGYPGFELDCQNDQVFLINISSMVYRVLDINNTTQTLRVARDDLWNSVCPRDFTNTTLNFTIFYYSSSANDQNITLHYGCTINPIVLPGISPYNVNCIANRPNSLNFYSIGENSWLGNGTTCDTVISVPVNPTAARALANPTMTSMNLLQESLNSGFSIQWFANNDNCNRCVQSGGVCGYNQESGLFSCYCGDQTHDLTCDDNRIGNGGSSNTGMNIGLPIGGAILAGIGVGWLIFYCRQRRKQRLAAKSLQTVSKDITPPPSSKPLSITPSTNFTASIPSYPSSKSDLGRGSAYFGVQVFSYLELEEATDNFNPSRELGDGGFGTVYYGVLSDGRIVAVKRLYENNFKRVEQFMNEVEILTRLRHENLVLLYGCTSNRSRELLLVYEYIPNGTVADHLHGKRAKSGLLSWPVRLKIAIETADALAYLHKSDIIHRDVKTNNILLDNDFHVKVADFGLSRLFPIDVTHVSTAPQGTPGYVDPEYYQCYQLTEKSDVYSFGVVLIELISSLQAVDTNRHRLDINLANMAVNKIQNHTLHELVDSSLGFETNSTVRRMATLIAELAFRCLQQERDMRPSMQEVLDALRRIQNEDLNAHKVEIVDISADEDTGLLKGVVDPPSPDSVATDKWASGLTPNSSL